MVQLYTCYERSYVLTQRSGKRTRIGGIGREDQKKERGYLNWVLKSELALDSCVRLAV